MISNYCKGKNFIVRNSRCHGIPLEETGLFYIRYLYSWPEDRMWKFLDKKLKDRNVIILSVKRIAQIHDVFLRVKIFGSVEDISQVEKLLNENFPKAKISYLKYSRRNHKFTYSSLRHKFLDPLTSTQNNSGTSSNSSISHNSISSLIKPTAFDLYPLNHISPANSLNNSNNFPFCLSWNTNGWNYDKKDSVEFFIAMYKPLFVCFQETGNGSGSNSNYPCRVTLKNYKYFFKKADEAIPGKRGLFLGYHNSCHASFENNSSEYIISLYTYSLWNGIKCSIGNVYVPQRRHNLHARTALIEILSWLNNHSSHPSILVGDFNLSTEKLKSRLENCDEWTILQLRGSPISWSRGDHESDIDHALVNKHMLNLLSHGSFIDYPLISDHKPLLISGKSIPTDTSFITPKKVIKWNRLKCLEEKESIFDNNLFNILEESMSDTNISINEASKNFISTSLSVAKNLNLVSDTEVKKSFFHMSNQIFILQKVKMKLYHEIKKNGSIYKLDEFCALINNYKKKCKIIHMMCNHFRKEEYQHWINSGCEYMKSHNPKKAWKWLKKTAKTDKYQNMSSQAIRDTNGNLISSTEGKLDIWQNHYKNLSSDPSGVSLSLDFWKNRTPNEKRYPEWNINQDISIEEIKSAILATPNYKAAGPDGIPIEFYKAFFLPNGNPDEDSRVTYGSGIKCLHILFTRIWNGEFPTEWNEASIISIPKKGDPSNCDNYRGISLINNGIKLISKIVTTRISDYGLKHNFIRPEQFGFRNKEESISLFISIREICQRRQFENKETYLAFLDLKKAYDSVPIGNILHKIDCLGIRGKCFQFIKNLYLSSKANVKVDGQYSKSFNIMKGVRQGCPLSPILFNLFINDIFNGCDNLGISLDNHNCCGGLFADDIVLCAPSRTKLKKLLKKVNDWAKFNNMNFGINKCATMVVRPNIPLFQNKRDPTFYLAGQPLPTTDCYTYLGVPFDKNLSLNPIVKVINNKLRKSLYSVSNFLKNPKIPLPFKKIIINSYIISKVSYFSPLLGSNKVRSNSAQKVVNKALRWAAGVHKAKSFTSVYSISKDFNIPPLSAKCALAQVKCFNKWKNSNCIISNLVNNIPKTRKHTWTKESKILKGKLEKRGDTTQAIKNFYWNRDLKQKSIKAKFYDDNKFEETSDFMKLCYEYPNLSYGFNWLLRARSGYKLDARVAKAAKFIIPVCPNYCPCCRKEIQTINHWLISCPSFNTIRQKVQDKISFVFNYLNHSHNNSNNVHNNDHSNNSVTDTTIGNNSVNESFNDISNVSVHGNNVYNNSSVSDKVFKFLLGGRNFNNNTREWKELIKCQLKSGIYSDSPFLVVTAALFQSIMPIAIGQQWSLFNRFKSTSLTTKSVNADNTVGQTSRVSATNEDHNFTT